jgi:tripartite-type tricarboxylate transporter receptor subunit TctC
MTGELFKVATGTNFLHVPYKGSGPAAMDVASGRVRAMFDATPSLMPYVQAVKLRVLAAASEKRNALLPNVPTFDPAHDTPTEFEKFMMDDYRRWGAVIKEANLTFE